MKSKTIESFKKEKKNLEDRIAALLVKFESDFGEDIVTHVSFDRHRTIGGSPISEVRVEVVF